MLDSYTTPGVMPGAGLIVMTDRPSVVQAAVALLMGADAYLPVDLDPSRAAEALDRVSRGRTHIEPETAEALHTLVVLAGGLQPDFRAQEIRLLLDLRSRGWGWGEAADSANLDPRAARAWLEHLLLRIRVGRDPSFTQLRPPCEHDTACIAGLPGRPGQGLGPQAGAPRSRQFREYGRPARMLEGGCSGIPPIPARDSREFLAWPHARPPDMTRHRAGP